MEFDDGSNDIVHPEVRAHINSLVSALGGYSAEDDGRYKLGDDALEVLRDLKKWIRFYDEKTNRMDVARCLAESHLVDGDLLQIMSQWQEGDDDPATGTAGENKSRFKARVALACLEIMVPLTWPLERDADKMTVNHHRHLPVLQLAQVAYKRAIVNFDGARILHTAVRTALPSMALPIAERTPRDQAVIKLVLFFLRNVATIVPPPGVQYDGDETQISRNATIDAFSYQDIFLTLLTIASNMGEDFRTEDTVLMEVIFHLVKRVNIEALFMDERQLDRHKAGELQSLMGKEASMLRANNRKAPSRHNRFGTMIWVERDGGRMSAISGQQALVDPKSRIQTIDDAKKFKPPRRSGKGLDPKDLGPPVTLNPRANAQLRQFVEDFLDAGFNPLFMHVRKSIDREAPHVLHEHQRQFFYLVAWFLEAERVRRRCRKASEDKQKKPTQSEEEIGSFNLVAGVLNQEMFISLNRAMTRAFDEKDWEGLSAAMRCFVQILSTVQEMMDSGNEENEEIAENILARLFYEEATHDIVHNISKSYKDQGFEYLDACTDLVHTFLRILEGYSKQNVDLQVRSRRRTRRKKKAAARQALGIDGEGDEIEDAAGGGDESANDEQDAERTTKERKFDFTRFANRFVQQGTVDTFVAFTKFYKDLDDAQLKRAHRFFYRVAFKQDLSVMLFRVDIIHLFHGMIKGATPLDRSTRLFKDWEELCRQVIKRCVRKLEERPALVFEMLFSKIQSTVFYLEYGHEKQTLSTTQPKPGAELEFKRVEERDRQIAILVGVLLDRGLAEHLDWLKGVLTAAESERRAWEGAERAVASLESQNAEGTETTAPLPAADAPVIAVRPDTPERKTAMFKNSYLRLLMSIVGLQRLAPLLDETPDSSWVVSPAQTADDIKESLALVHRAEFSPPTFDEGELAEDQLRRKSARRPARKKAAFDDDDDDGLRGAFLDDDGEEDFLFPAGGPTNRRPADELLELARKRRQRRKQKKDDEDNGESSADDEIDDAARRQRALDRRRRELEKRRRVKSALYVDAADDLTDDERDREFYAREEEIRRRAARIAAEVDGPFSVRKAAGVDADEAADADAEEGEEAAMRRRIPARKRRLMADDGDDDADDAPTRGASGSEAAASSSSKKKRKTTRSAPSRSAYRTIPSLSDDEDDERSVSSSDGDDDVEEDHAAEDTPPTVSSSSPHASSPRTDKARAKGRRLLSKKRKAPSSPPAVVDGDIDMLDVDATLASATKDVAAAERVQDHDNDDDDDDAEVAAATATRRRRRVGGFLDDSDDE